MLAKAELPGRADVGALRLRTVATKDRRAPTFPISLHSGQPKAGTRGPGDNEDPAAILDLDCWAPMPR